VQAYQKIIQHHPKIRSGAPRSFSGVGLRLCITYIFYKARKIIVVILAYLLILKEEFWSITLVIHDIQAQKCHLS
jgi:hypothetical protein